ncbi:MAG: methyltransferase type 11, partial [Desulfovibrio sp.]|nr:methyltransferase type 11 [Desulfovibrio sp.]
TLVADGFLEEPAYITQAGYPIAPLDILYGWRLALAQGQMHMAHHCGFTEKSLANAFLQAGFRSVAMRRQRRLLQLAASASVRPLSDVQVQDMLAAHIGPAQ